MFLNELFEAIDQRRHAVFTFGRMNPPTIGHGQLLKTVEKAAKGSDYFIFVSQTQDSKKNPLQWQQKLSYLAQMFPDFSAHIVRDPMVRTIPQILTWLYDHGYRSVSMVAGSDRLPQYQELLPKYNGVTGQNGSYYNFDSINFVSSGDRDPDSEGLGGVSATKARKAAEDADIDAFIKATGAPETIARQMMADVREGLRLPSLNEAHQHTEVIRHQVGKWIVYLDNHSIPRAMTRGIGPRMMSNLVTYVGMIPDLENKVPVGGAFWIKDHKTNSSLYFKRLDIPSESFAVRCETAVKDDPRANSRTPIFTVNAYTGPERPEHLKSMARMKYISQFTGVNPMASNLSKDIQKGVMGQDPELIRNPETQDSKRYDRAFSQAQRVKKKDMAEDASGYIPKNKREAKDPRWSNALTVDVTPETPTKNARALRLI